MISNFRGKYFFLSNFYRSPVTYNYFTYPTSEHAYQAEKCKDINEKIQISEAVSPRDAKNLGQKVSMRDDWDDVKFYIMKEILKEKFSYSPMRNKLLETQPEFLIEGNKHHDNIFGNCLCGRDECLVTGKNMLGKILMELRISYRTFGSFE